MQFGFPDLSKVYYTAVHCSKPTRGEIFTIYADWSIFHLSFIQIFQQRLLDHCFNAWPKWSTILKLDIFGEMDMWRGQIEFNSSEFILKIFSIIIFTINFVSGTWELLLQLKATWRHSIVCRVLQIWHWYQIYCKMNTQYLEKADFIQMY